MADDGYLVGYEDENENFVEVGRFNNTSENVSDPLIIQHSDSGQSIELGPNGFSTESVSTESLVIGGTLYDEDDNSPLSGTGTSVTYTVSGDYDEVIIIPDPAGASHDQIRVNGDSGSNYDIVDNADNVTQNLSQWETGLIQRAYPFLQIRDTNSEICLYAPYGRAGAGETIAGSNGSEGGNGLNSITFADSGGVSRTIAARVFGRTIL